MLELARSEYILRRENIIVLGRSGTGKSHVALALGLAACQRGLAVGFTTAVSLVNQLLEARDEKRLLRLQTQLAGCKLLIIDEVGYVPLLCARPLNIPKAIPDFSRAGSRANKPAAARTLSHRRSRTD